MYVNPRSLAKASSQSGVDLRLTGVQWFDWLSPVKGRNWLVGSDR